MSHLTARAATTAATTTLFLLGAGVEAASAQPAPLIPDGSTGGGTDSVPVAGPGSGFDWLLTSVVAVLAVAVLVALVLLVRRTRGSAGRLATQ
ncbi:MAG: hypothetical protein QOJ60_1715 [Actinomycetota bacterium]|jgi:hypothetical protein|nr:hypothetical protein [Actinomycetota bacterium]